MKKIEIIKNGYDILRIIEEKMMSILTLKDIGNKKVLTKIIIKNRF